MSKKVKVEGEGEEVRGKVEEAQGETYEATADGFFDWCVDRGIQVPMLFMSEYCDIEILRRKFKGFSAQNEALGHALNDLRRKYFENIKWFLKDVAAGVTREQIRTPSEEMTWLKAYRSAFESGSKIELSTKEKLLFARSTARIFGKSQESPSPVKPEGAAEENLLRSEAGAGKGEAPRR